MSLPEYTPETLYDLLLVALQSWAKPSATADRQLQAFLTYKAECPADHDPEDPAAHRLIVNQLLLNLLDTLTDKQPEAAALLRRRFLDDATVRELALALHTSVDVFNRRQRSAVEALAALLWGREQRLRAQRRERQLEGLPTQTYDRLFGVEALIERTVDWLAEPLQPHVVVVAGMGGIGKTALADATVRRLINRYRFDEVIPIVVKPQPLSGAPATAEQTWEQVVQEALAHYPDLLQIGSPNERSNRVRRRLQHSACLLWIDNVEEADAATLLVRRLADWVNPAKALVTTRALPQSERAVALLPLTELAFGDAEALMRHLAQENQLPELAAAPVERLRPIYEVTGGNPLAIKLVISLIATLDLDAVLADLRRGGLPPTQELYGRIYRRVWQTLSAEARDLLIGMTLLPASGGAFADLMRPSELTETQALGAVRELSLRSLLEVSGPVWERRYAIHRLTQSFLMTEIIGWPPTADDATAP